jgi:hypothetical protein
MELVLRTALIVACQQAVMRFFSALDAGRLDEVADAVAEDGVWHRQGAALSGPSAVRAALAARPAGRITAHLVQDLVVGLEAENDATVRYLVLTYRYDAPEGAGGVAPMGKPLSIAAYSDRMRRSGETWLVKERRSRVIFGPN